MSDERDNGGKRDVTSSALAGSSILVIALIGFCATFYQMNEISPEKFSVMVKEENAHYIEFMGSNDMKLNTIHQAAVDGVNLAWKVCRMEDFNHSFKEWGMWHVYMYLPNALLWCSRRVLISAIALIFCALVALYAYLRVKWERDKLFNTDFLQSPRWYEIGMTMIMAGTAYCASYGFVYMPITGPISWVMWGLASYRFVLHIFQRRFEFAIPMLFMVGVQYMGLYGLIFGLIFMVWGVFLLTKHFPEHA